MTLLASLILWSSGGTRGTREESHIEVYSLQSIERRIVCWGHRRTLMY